MTIKPTTSRTPLAIAAVIVILAVAAALALTWPRGSHAAKDAATLSSNGGSGLPSTPSHPSSGPASSTAAGLAASSAAPASAPGATPTSSAVAGSTPTPTTPSPTPAPAPKPSTTPTQTARPTPSSAAGQGRQPSATPAPTPTAAAPAAATHTMTFVNAVNEMIWLAASPDPQHPMPATGWKLPPGQQVSVAVPDGWSGRFWGRTGCTFDSGGAGHCQTGDCSNAFQCPNSGKTPATLAEFSLDAWNGLDFYDVSLVDGSNLPMYINIAKGETKDPISANGCSAAGCTKAVACPDPMKIVADGVVIGCHNACDAFGTDDYCCRGAWSGRDNCDPTKWPVNYTTVFKDAEPYAYSYPFDDTATMACKGSCDFRVTFGVTPGG